MYVLIQILKENKALSSKCPEINKTLCQQMRERLLHAVTFENGCVLDRKFISSSFYVLVTLLLSHTWLLSITGRCSRNQSARPSSWRKRPPSGPWGPESHQGTVCTPRMSGPSAERLYTPQELSVTVPPDWTRPLAQIEAQGHCAFRKEALRTVWTIKPCVSIYFLRFDRDTTSETSSCLGSGAGVRDKQRCVSRS